MQKLINEPKGVSNFEIYGYKGYAPWKKGEILMIINGFTGKRKIMRICGINDYIL